MMAPFPSRTSNPNIRLQSQMVLAAHYRAFKRAKEYIIRTDVHLARHHAGPRFNAAQAGYLVEIPANWRTGSTHALRPFLEAWRPAAFAALGEWRRAWFLLQCVLSKGSPRLRLYVTAENWGCLIRGALILFGGLVLFIQVLLRVCYIQVGNHWGKGDGNPLRGVRTGTGTIMLNGEIPPFSTSSTTPPKPSQAPLPREIIMACNLMAELADLEQENDPSVISLYDLLYRSPSSATFPFVQQAREIPQDDLIKSFASAINEGWKELGAMCGTGMAGMPARPKTAIDNNHGYEEEMPKRGWEKQAMCDEDDDCTRAHHDLHHRSDSHKVNSGTETEGTGEEDKENPHPLCLSPEARALRKRHELTIKAAAFLSDTAHRRVYDDKFQRSVEEARRRRGWEWGWESDDANDDDIEAQGKDAKALQVVRKRGGFGVWDLGWPRWLRNNGDGQGQEDNAGYGISGPGLYVGGSQDTGNHALPFEVICARV
ncbi:hypothetical protein F5Y12DRAFT_161679 [Xylaria sp. FL1777]|nr:hypothetical protein F5Y12DRAFT_161679 [Xylaria sp. FL1777]